MREVCHAQLIYHHIVWLPAAHRTTHHVFNGRRNSHNELIFKSIRILSHKIENKNPAETTLVLWAKHLKRMIKICNLIIVPSFAHVSDIGLIFHYHSYDLPALSQHQPTNEKKVHCYVKVDLRPWSRLTWFIRNLIWDTPFSFPSIHIILSPRMFLLFFFACVDTNCPSW